MKIKIKDPGSALTHFIAMLLALFAAAPLLGKAARGSDSVHLVWGIALVGIVINAFWISCPKWFSSLIYIAMGWACVLAFSQIVQALPPAAFGWLLAGGIIYTIGGVIYALKLPIFNSKHKNFGSHEIFHLFVMGGSLCHYVMMYGFVA